MSYSGSCHGTQKRVHITGHFNCFPDCRNMGFCKIRRYCHRLDITIYDGIRSDSANSGIRSDSDSGIPDIGTGRQTARKDTELRIPRVGQPTSGSCVLHVESASDHRPGHPAVQFVERRPRTYQARNDLRLSALPAYQGHGRHYIPIHQEHTDTEIIMERIILIETSTALCSVALAEDGDVTAYRESSAPKAHASLTAVFVQEVLQERGLKLSDCNAVCVSKGPGSYTGLRVGVSTAKGLCFGSGLPLLAVGTLDTLVAQATMSSNTSVMSSEVETSPDYKYIIPMIDARRMEVYSAVFTTEGSQITETAPVIVDENSFSDYLQQGPCLFIGDGAGKCADVIRHPNACFIQCNPKASAMLKPALAALSNKDFCDVAYFEPFYLKEFVATVSKKKLF